MIMRLPVEQVYVGLIPTFPPNFRSIMRQIRITTQNLDYPQDGDCYIAPDDPLHAIKKANMLGGLAQAPTIDADRAELVDKFFNPENEQYKNSMKRKGEIMAMLDK